MFFFYSETVLIFWISLVYGNLKYDKDGYLQAVSLWFNFKLNYKFIHGDGRNCSSVCFYVYFIGNKKKNFWQNGMYAYVILTSELATHSN